MTVKLSSIRCTGNSSEAGATNVIYSTDRICLPPKTTVHQQHVIGRVRFSVLQTVPLLKGVARRSWESVFAVLGSCP